MDTLLLDPKTWDFRIDSSGNIAMASAPYALAQDVASALRLFKGELWYNTAKGIPYFDEVLGHAPPLSLLKKYFADAALSVPGVVSAVAIITSANDRVLTGQVQFIDATGASHNIIL